MQIEAMMMPMGTTMRTEEDSKCNAGNDSNDNVEYDEDKDEEESGAGGGGVVVVVVMGRAAAVIVVISIVGVSCSVCRRGPRRKNRSVMTIMRRQCCRNSTGFQACGDCLQLCQSTRIC